MQIAKKICSPLCQVEKTDRLIEESKEAKPNNPEGCLGFGKEICYKICRLHHTESIQNCLFACCDS